VDARDQAGETQNLTVLYVFVSKRDVPPAPSKTKKREPVDRLPMAGDLSATSRNLRKSLAEYGGLRGSGAKQDYVDRL
jgi:hypothetical protein